MSAPTLPLRNRLRAIDAGRAESQTRLIAALNRRLVDGLATAARVASERDRRAAAAWIRFRAGDQPVRVAPLLVDNALARVANARGEPDAASAAAALGRIEPLIAALELVFGCELHPDGLEAAFNGEPLMLRLDAGPQAGSIAHRLLLAVPEDLPVEPRSLPRTAPGAIADLRLRWTARVAGPGVALPRLGQLGRGDLLILGTGPLMARLSLPGRNGRPRARVDVQQGELILQQDPASDEGASVASEPGGEPAIPLPDLGEFRVETVIEIAGSTLTASELATLGRGSVLPVDARGGALEVRVLAGGKPVARGELVAVGEGYGVLVTALAGEAAD